VELTYHNAHLLNAPIGEVFRVLYSADELKSVVRELLFAPGEAPEIKWKKTECADKIAAAIQDPDQLELMLMRMTLGARRALEHLVWHEDARVKDVERELGLELTLAKSRFSQSWRDHVNERDRKPEFYFLVLSYLSNPYEYGLSAEQRGRVYLPTSLRNLLRQHLKLKPWGYDWEPIAGPEPHWMRFGDEASALNDLSICADMLIKGHLEFGKSSSPVLAGLKKLRVLLNSGEFFPFEAKDRRLGYLRSEMMTLLLGNARKTQVQKFQGVLKRPEAIRELIQVDLLQNANLVHRLFLTHLQGSIHASQYDAQGMSEMMRLFASLPENAWVRADNLECYATFRNLRVMPFDDEVRVKANVDTKNYSLESLDVTNRRYLSGQAWPLLYLPFMRGFSFLLASLGMAEIAYMPPTPNPLFSRNNATYLTEFDGLRAIRLTEMGRYVLGAVKSYTIKSIKRSSSELLFSPDTFDVSAPKIDPISELSLQEYMEKLGPGYFRMTRRSFLKGVQSNRDCQVRRELFHAAFGDELPPNWTEFLDHLQRTCHGLIQMEDWVVYELGKDPELRRLMVQDSVLKDLVHKVEGLRVAFPRERLGKVKKRLEEFGYFVG
jgi:hypothetical protein